MNYTEIKQLIERRTIVNKKGKLTDEEIKALVKELHDHRAEEELNDETVEREMKSMELTIARYNVEQLGEMPTEREDGAVRILVCQMGGLASPEVRAIKIEATERHIEEIHVVLIYPCLLVESKLLGKFSIMVSRGEGGQISHSAQHNRATFGLFETSTKRHGYISTT